jgi:hypothetical protein
MRYRKNTFYAHRFSYERFVGELTETQGVFHRCDNPVCVNPEHLFAGRQLENIHDAIRKGRIKATPLTDEEVLEIRDLYNHRISQPEIATQFNIHQSYVSRLVNDRRRINI